MNYEQIILEPVITEKSVGERALGRYVFKVHLDSTKISVKQAVEHLFKVKVVDVNTCYVRAKIRSTGGRLGRTSHWKKAYVTLTKGQKIQELET